MYSLTNAAVFLCFTILGALAAPCIAGPCQQNGEAKQTMILIVGASDVAEWEVVPAEIRRVRLPNGVDIGVQIEPATVDKYKEILNKSGVAGVDELAKMSLYDFTTSTPILKSSAWVGSNSRQIYSGKQSLNFGSSGATFWLHKAHCILPSDLGVTIH